METEEMAGIDWRRLLIKYIEHVGQCEGVDFLSDDHRAGSGFMASSDVEFTDDEWSALQSAGGERRDTTP